MENARTRHHHHHVVIFEPLAHSFNRDVDMSAQASSRLLVVVMTVHPVAALLHRFITATAISPVMMLTAFPARREAPGARLRRIVLARSLCHCTAVINFTLTTQ